MNIKSIFITNLFFENLNNFIEIDKDLPVTYLIGRNGSGKTTILRLLDSIANNNWSFIINTRFELFEINFFENATIRLEKKSGDLGTNIFINLFTNSEAIIENHMLEVESFDYKTVHILINKLLDAKIIRKKKTCEHWEDDRNIHLRKDDILR